MDNCDICPSPEKNHCLGLIHDFICEAVEHELNQPEHMKHYTRKITKTQAKLNVESKEIKRTSLTYSRQARKSKISIEQYDLAVSLAKTCEHLTLEKKPHQCCKRICKIGKQKPYVSLQYCVISCRLQELIQLSPEPS